MAKFDAASAVEGLEYDFTKYVDGCEGVIPEPSTDQLEAYFKEMSDFAQSARALQNKAQGVQAGTLAPEEIDEVLASMNEVSIAHFIDVLADAAGRLCSDQPSAEQIKGLPYRVLQAFIQWITGEFRPEGGAATTRR